MENSTTPHNALTGVAYKGSNVPTLTAAVLANGYTSFGFVTFKQALEMGRVVRKGEKACARVVRWFKVGEKGSAVESETEAKTKGRMTSKSWAVFNLDQTEALPVETAKAA